MTERLVRITYCLGALACILQLVNKSETAILFWIISQVFGEVSIQKIRVGEYR